METKSCAFFGHWDTVKEKYGDKLLNIFTDLIENKGVTKFYSGFCGYFDLCCRNIIHELKFRYPQIKLTKVLYDMHPIYDGYDRLAEEYRPYDDSVYLLNRRVPRQFAVQEIDRLVVDKVDFIVAGVTPHDCGGFAAVEYACKRKKTVISVFDGWEV